MAEGEINIDNIIQRLLEGKISTSPAQIITLRFDFPLVERCWFPFLCVAERCKYFLKWNFSLSVRGSRPGKTVQMTEAEVRGLCLKSRELFLQQPILLELEAPLKICGEWHSNTVTL